MISGIRCPDVLELVHLFESHHYCIYRIRFFTTHVPSASCSFDISLAGLDHGLQAICIIYQSPHTAIGRVTKEVALWPVGLRTKSSPELCHFFRCKSPGAPRLSYARELCTCRGFDSLWGPAPLPRLSYAIFSGANPHRLLA